jgi:hypothetical protein
VINRLKIHPNIGKSCQNSCKSKRGQNVLIESQFERPNHLFQTAFEMLKQLHLCLQTADLGENVKQNRLSQN